MRGDRHGRRTDAPEMAGLEHCPDCDRDFVVATLLELVDDGLYLLGLHCKNCGRLAAGVHEDAELELMEGHHEMTASAIQASLDRVRAEDR